MPIQPEKQLFTSPGFVLYKVMRRALKAFFNLYEKIVFCEEVYTVLVFTASFDSKEAEPIKRD
jgi:hypothetical protein